MNGTDGRRQALIVANDAYADEGLKQLRSPAEDAVALGGVLGDPQIGAFDVEVIRNESAHVIEGRIEDFFAERRPPDVLLLHFSCHGLKSDSGDLYFAATNTRPNRLASTAVPAAFVRRCMRESRSRSIVLLLDCCYGGAFSRGTQTRAGGSVDVLESFEAGKLGGGRGWAVITASNAMEYAFEGDTLSDGPVRRPSLFTSAVVEGLATGEADRDEDGRVSLDELYEYVFDRVHERNPHQTPSRSFELPGDLYLAHSPRRRLRPEPVPADLRAAMTDPNMFTRLGAVTELRARLAGPDVAAALGAYEALAEVVDTDIRMIAEPAEQALRDVALTPVESEADFGIVELGGPAPHRTLALLGPPLARTCTPQGAPPWLHIADAPQGVDLSVDTAEAGLLRGEAVLRGPTGEATVRVAANVIPVPPGRPGAGPQSRPGPRPRARAATPPHPSDARSVRGLSCW
ncbi:caspase family protein [Kitasatospora sp. NPDC054939]